MNVLSQCITHIIQQHSTFVICQNVRTFDQCIDRSIESKADPKLDPRWSTLSFMDI